METGGNLASIASNTSTTNTKIDGTNTRLDTVNNNLVYINSGLTTINNTIINKHLSSTNDSVSAQISNTSLDVHCYASSNSTTWHHLKSDANGVLNVHSMLHDGAVNDLTSSAIGTTRNLDTIATLYANNSGTKSAITSTNGSLNANITNSSIAVSGTVNIGNTPSVNANITNSSLTVSDTTSQGYLNTINQKSGYSYIENNTINNVSITAGNYSNFITWTRGAYKQTIFSYSDGATSNTETISLYTKDISGNNVFLTTFYPYVNASARRYSGVLNLLPLNTIAVRNDSASATITGATLTMFSA